MDYRCPCCGKDLRSRKLVHAVIARMEMDCTHCNRRIRLNMHPLEEKIVFASFGSFLVLVVLAWSLKSEALTLLAIAAGMVVPTALPVLERTWLRSWTRYVPASEREKT
jgi:DNA-directed RNA polymerase subunit RPC12/RpoP